VRGLPRHGRHVDRDVRVLLLELGGELPEHLPLIAHRPDGDLAGGRGVVDGLAGGVRRVGSVGSPAPDERHRPDEPESDE